MARTVILGNGGFAHLLASMVDADCIDKGEPVPDDVDVIIGVGDIKLRKKLYLEHRERVRGVDAYSIPHRSGIQIMVGAVIQPGVNFGNNVLVNFGALIDHDCNIGDHCVISPGAILCGNVTLGEGCFVGAGAIIIQEVVLEPNTFVPAGTLVVSNSDFRKPQRMVRHVRAFQTKSGATYEQELSEASVG